MRLPTKSLTAAASLFALLATSAGCTEVSEDGGGGSGSEATSTTSTSSGAGVAIQCGSASCSECCLDNGCASKAACEQAFEDSLVIYCDGPEDCTNGTTCCSCPPLAGSTSITAACNAPALCADCWVAYYFCHSASDCGGNKTCDPWELADYVSVCSE